jgi:acetolactate decarboxylase
MAHELRCLLPEGIWAALQRRADESGEPIAHLVSRALADALDVEHHTVFQVSTVGALAEGVYQGAVRVETLREHGDFGLGTFEGLDGELVVVDGAFLQVRADGDVRAAPDDALSPYAVVTRFVPEHLVELAVDDLDDLYGRLDEARDTENHFFAFRLDGDFAGLHLRAACRVAEGTPLAEATEGQTEWHLDDARGTVVGFWSPDYAARFDVAGYHLHFLTDDRRHGGHVLAFHRARITARWQRLEQLVVALPETGDFLAADLRSDPGNALAQAERARPGPSEPTSGPAG